MAENSRRWAEISRRYRTYIKLEKRLSANTVESYMRDLEQFAHFVLRMWDVPPRKVESQMIERYMAWLYDRGCEKSSQARALSGLKSFFNYLLLTDAIESSPLEFIEMPKFSRRLPDVPRSTGFSPQSTARRPRACATTRCSNCSIRADCVSRS